MPAQAQYSTPTLDGNVSAAEHNGQSFTSVNPGGTGGTWYMTWDATYLYVGKSLGSSNEPMTLYFDVDPYLPVTGGGNANGNTAGVLDNGVTPRLPF